MKFKRIPGGPEQKALFNLRTLVKVLKLDQTENTGELSVEKCFAEAEYYEQLYVQLSPIDPVRAKYWQVRQNFLNAAAYLDVLSDCIDFSSGKFKTVDELYDALRTPNGHPEIAALAAAATNKE